MDTSQIRTIRIHLHSLVQLEHEHGIRRNPFINAGALVVSDILVPHLKNAKSSFLDYVRQRANNASIQNDPQVARSERQSSFRNAAMANFLKSFANLMNEIEEMLEFYYFQCSLSMSCVDLAKGFFFSRTKGTALEPISRSSPRVRQESERPYADLRDL